WLYSLEANEWRLVLVSPQVDTEGPRKIYGMIWDALYKRSDRVMGLDLLSISVFSPDDTLVRALASANDLVALSGKRLTRNRLNGVFIEDVYIYFVKDSVKPLPGPKWLSK